MRQTVGVAEMIIIPLLVDQTVNVCADSGCRGVGHQENNQRKRKFPTTNEKNGCWNLPLIVEQFSRDSASLLKDSIVSPRTVTLRIRHYLLEKLFGGRFLVAYETPICLQMGIIL